MSTFDIFILSPWYKMINRTGGKGDGDQLPPEVSTFMPFFSDTVDLLFLILFLWEIYQVHHVHYYYSLYVCNIFPISLHRTGFTLTYVHMCNFKNICWIRIKSKSKQNQSANKVHSLFSFFVYKIGQKSNNNDSKHEHRPAIIFF